MYLFRVLLLYCGVLLICGWFVYVVCLFGGRWFGVSVLFACLFDFVYGCVCFAFVGYCCLLVLELVFGLLFVCALFHVVVASLITTFGLLASSL